MLKGTFNKTNFYENRLIGLYLENPITKKESYFPFVVDSFMAINALAELGDVRVTRVVIEYKENNDIKIITSEVFNIYQEVSFTESWKIQIAPLEDKRFISIRYSEDIFRSLFKYLTPKKVNNSVYLKQRKTFNIGLKNASLSKTFRTLSLYYTKTKKGRINIINSNIPYEFLEEKELVSCPIAIVATMDKRIKTFLIKDHQVLHNESILLSLMDKKGDILNILLHDKDPFYETFKKIYSTRGKI